MAEPGSTPAEQLRHLFLSFRVSQAIYAVTELGIADQLGDGPRAVTDLARATGAHAPSLYRVLRLLASEGVFTETLDGRFALTPPAEYLRREVPGSQRPVVRYNASEPSWLAWGKLLHSVRTGEPSFPQVHGQELFAYLRAHPEDEARFGEVMTAFTAPVTQAVAAAYDFGPFRRVVDIGGGQGALIIGLLQEYPHLHGVVFDQSAVAELAQVAIEQAGLGQRAEAVGGDFFTEVPAGGDLYLLKWVLHDWDDAACRTILQHCRRVMPAEGRLLVVEALIPPGNKPSLTKSLDVTMLVMSEGGRERTSAEYEALLAAGGFRLAQAIPALDELHMLEAIPA